MSGTWQCFYQDRIYIYSLTAWYSVRFEKLTGLQLVKKFPAFHGTRRYITALTSVRQLSLSWASPIQSIYPHPTSWRSILILSTQLRIGELEILEDKNCCLQFGSVEWCTWKVHLVNNDPEWWETIYSAQLTTRNTLSFGITSLNSTFSSKFREHNWVSLG